MIRFSQEIVKACGDVIGYSRVGIRLSPGAYLNEIVGETRDSEVFSHLLSELNKLSIAYVHTGNIDDTVKFPELNHQTMTQFIRKHYSGHVIASGGYGFNEGEKGVAQGDFDLVSIGRHSLPTLI